MPSYLKSDLDRRIASGKHKIVSSLGPRSIDSQICDPRKGSNLELNSGPESIRKERDTINYSGQCVVRVKAFRRRLCDPDGNCFKYHIDFLRYIGAIKDDNDAAIRLIFEPQEKVADVAQERCEITVEYPSVDRDRMFVSHPL